MPRRTWDALIAVQSTREATPTMVGLLALADDQGVEADLAVVLDAILDAGDLLDFGCLRARFTPATVSAPYIRIEMPYASIYDPLLGGLRGELAAGMTITTETARLPLLLTTLRLPTVARLQSDIRATADNEGWLAARTLSTLLEHEVAGRANRRTAQ